jgi:hypothetical protein
LFPDPPYPPPHALIPFESLYGVVGISQFIVGEKFVYLIPAIDTNALRFPATFHSWDQMMFFQIVPVRHVTPTQWACQFVFHIYNILIQNQFIKRDFGQVSFS